MATLSDINKTLSTQNASLEGIDFSIDKLNSNINKLIDNLTGLDALEQKRKEDRERENEKRKQRDDSRGNTSGSAGPGGLPFDPSSIFSAAGLAGAGLTLGKFLLKRGLPALILNSLADNIADYIEGETGSKELGDALYRGIKLGSIGLLLGKRFGLIGAAVGVLLTDENKKKLEEMGENFGELKKKFENMFDVTLPGADELITGITTTFGDALDGINAALSGDWEGFEDNLGSLALAVGGLFALFRPGKAVSLALKTLTWPFRKAGVAIGAATAAGAAVANSPKTGGRGVGPTAADIQAQRDLDNYRNRATPDSQGRVKSQSGKLYGANTSQGKAITQGFREAEAKFNKEYNAQQKAMKNPRFAKFAKLPGIVGAGINLALLGAILTDDTLTAKEKAKQSGGLLTGIAGTMAGGAIGGLILGPFGALAGGTAGYFAGDYLGQKLMEWMLGADIPQMTESDVKGLTGAGARKNRRGGAPSGVNVEIESVSPAAKPATGSVLSDVATEAQAMSKQPIVIQDNSSRTNVGGSTTNQAIAMPPPNPFDLSDPFNGTRGFAISN